MQADPFGRRTQVAQGRRRRRRYGDDHVGRTGLGGDLLQGIPGAMDAHAIDLEPSLGLVVVEHGHGLVGRVVVVHEVAHQQPTAATRPEDDDGNALRACRDPLDGHRTGD